VTASLYGGGIGDIYRDELEQLVSAIPVWRPIDEAPIPDHELVPIYWHYPCMIQDEAGVVYAGFARYATGTNTRSPTPARVLRWYEGISQRYAQILKPRYYQPLPQPRKD
jgi:hypothetical protein